MVAGNAVVKDACNDLDFPSESPYMNNLLARCSHLFPSLREAWYTIPLRLMVGKSRSCLNPERAGRV